MATDPNREKGVPGKLSRWILRFLLCGAVLISGYLSYISLTNTQVPGCGGESGCHSVLSSRWSQWFGLPVSLAAVGTYLMMLFATFFLGFGIRANTRRKAWFVLVSASVLVSLAIIWFVVLQVAVMKVICIFCMSAHAFGLLAIITVLACWPIAKINELKWTSNISTISPKVLLGAMALGLGGFGVMATGQLLGPAPETHQLQQINTNNKSLADSGNSKKQATQNNSKNTPPDPALDLGRVVPYIGGHVKFSTKQTPMLGSPDSEHITLELFDYTCATCRQLSPQISKTLERYGDQIAVFAVPNPINHKCNSYLAPGILEHENACEYARLGMAVWKAKPEQFETYHNWLMLSKTIPPLEQAQARAIKIMGREAFDKVMQDPSISRMLQRGGKTFRMLGGGIMPKVILKDKKMFSGAPRSTEDLFQMLEEALNIKRLQRTY